MKKHKFFWALIKIMILLLMCGLFWSGAWEKVLYPYPYKKTVERYAEKYGSDPLLVVSLIRVESTFRAKCSSSKGALGLMQLMPSTAMDVAARLGEDYKDVDLFDPDDNIRYGTWYFAYLMREFSGDKVLALAAYNAGCGRVRQWQAEVFTENGDPREEIPFTETREYVAKVLQGYEKYKELYGMR